MSDLFKRSVTGLIYVVALLVGTLIHPIIFAVVFGGLLFFTQFEFYNLVEKAGFAPQKKVGLILGFLLFLNCFGVVYKIIPQQFALLFIPFIILIFLFEVLRTNKNSIQNSSFTLLGLIYIGTPFCLMSFIIYPGFPENAGFYPWILVGIFFIAWINDSMAYLGGSLFGKHKMAENISPKKTWEGFISGAVFAIVIGILNAVLFQALSMLSWIVIAVIIVVFGTLGDLFESKFKRSLNIKDSGNVLPGHGGFLDRLDSLLFSIPIIYFWLINFGKI